MARRSAPTGSPHELSVSGSCGGRSRSGASEPARKRVGEGYAACGDEAEQEKYKHPAGSGAAGLGKTRLRVGQRWYFARRETYGRLTARFFRSAHCMAGKSLLYFF